MPILAAQSRDAMIAPFTPRDCLACGQSGVPSVERKYHQFQLFFSELRRWALASGCELKEACERGEDCRRMGDDEGFAAGRQGEHEALQKVKHVAVERKAGPADKLS